MSELKIIKRQDNFNYLPFAVESLIRIEKPKGRIYISGPAAKIIGIKEGEKVAFAFSEYEAYIFKSNDDDAFLLRRRENEDRLQFTAKCLLLPFDNFNKVHKYNKNNYKISPVFKLIEKKEMFPIRINSLGQAL